MRAEIIELGLYVICAFNSLVSLSRLLISEVVSVCGLDDKSCLEFGFMFIFMLLGAILYSLGQGYLIIRRY